MNLVRECLVHFSQAISAENPTHFTSLFHLHDQSPHSILATYLATCSEQLIHSSVSSLIHSDSPEFDIIYSFLIFLKSWGLKSNYTALHRSYSLLYKSFLNWVGTAPRQWALPLLKVLQTQLIDISKLADFECKDINIAGEEHIHATFEMLNMTLQTLEEKGNIYNLGLLLTFNSFFNLYWKVDQSRRDQLWETIYSKQIDIKPYPKAYQVCFHYHVGHRLLQLGLHSEAEPHLVRGLQLCPVWSTRNHQKLVCSLLLCRLFQGSAPPLSWLQTYQMDVIFTELIRCLPCCDYTRADQWITKHTAFLLQNKIFFILLDQLRYLMIRRCLRCCISAYLYVSDPDLSKPRRMPLRYFAYALDMMFQELSAVPSDSLFSAYHKLTHLLAQGYARGYISLVHKIYVMPKTNDLKMIAAPIRASQ